MSIAHSMPQHRQPMLPYHKTDYVKPANVHARKQTSGYFHSQVVYSKLEEFEITDLGKTAKLLTATFQTTYITPTILRINFPTTNRRRRSPTGNLYGNRFYISVSYDNIHFGESMPIVIFNDVCYTCSALTLECNITRTCKDSSTRQNTNIKKNKEGNDISLALITVLCIVSIIIPAVVCVLLYLKIRPTTRFSSKVDIKKPSSMCGQFPPQLYETINKDCIPSQPPNYKSLSPQSFTTTSVCGPEQLYTNHCINSNQC